jgi:hypothetical protein
MSTLKITPKMLREAWAYVDQYEIYVKEWPDGMLVTRESLNRALELGLDIDFLAQHFFKGKQLEFYTKRYALALKKWEKSCGLAAKIAAETYNLASQKHYETCAPHRKEREKTCDLARKICSESCGLALKIFFQECFEAFLNALEVEE